MRRLLVCFLFGVFSWSVASASDTDVLRAIGLRNFTALEKYFADIDSRFERHELAERDLVDAYRPFYQGQEPMRRLLTSWIEKKPSSYAAYLARGIYFRKLGQFKRGTGYISEVPPENLEYMDKMYELAKSDLLMAQRLRPSSYLAALHLLNIAQSDGDQVAARRNLELANKAFPENFMARARYLSGLEPRWGGSHAMMNSFIREVESGGAPEQHVRWLRAIELDDRGSISLDQGHPVEAREHFVEALRLSDDADERFHADYVRYSVHYCSGPKRDGLATCDIH